MNRKIKRLLLLLFVFFINLSGVRALTVEDVDFDTYVNSHNPFNLVNFENSDITVDLKPGMSKKQVYVVNMNYYYVTIPKDYVSSDGTSIKVTYPEVGTYMGRRIGVNATYTVYQYNKSSAVQGNLARGEVGLSNYEGIVISLPFNFSDGGTGFFNSKYNKLKYEFFYSGTNQIINVRNAKFIFSSLNYQVLPNRKKYDESIFFESDMASRISKIQKLKDYNNITIRTSPGRTPSFAYSLGIVPISQEGFVEGQQSKYDVKSFINSASVEYSGESLEFIIGASSEDSLLYGAVTYQPASEKDASADYRDYSLDAACVNCDSNNADNKAMVIQDITDWDSILNSSKASCNNIKNYYKVSNGASNTYCREEYHVYYPNVNNKIAVNTGRFFTLNASDEEMKLVDGTISNFKPIKVTRIRQCKGDGLGSYKAKTDNSFKSSGSGTIKLKYNEDKYKYDGNLDSDIVSFDSKMSGDMLVQMVTYNYRLPSDTYRYVRLEDGYSIKSSNGINVNEGIYKDLKVSNLPISFNSKNANVSFKYSLPSSSKISKAYNSQNDYFSCSGNEYIDNVYKRAGNGDNDAINDLPNTACAKLFGSTTNSKFKKCINERKENKLGNCFNGDYSCKIDIKNHCDPLDPSCSDPDPTSVIYRVVDVLHPFITQNGKVRDTGNNWCSTDGDTKNCSGNSPYNIVIKKVITDRKNISSDNAMYRVKLDSKTITSIRKYNDKNDYDDFKLKCDADGNACISTFLRSKVSLEGKCNRAHNFYDCSN